MRREEEEEDEEERVTFFLKSCTLFLSHDLLVSELYMSVDAFMYISIII